MGLSLPPIPQTEYDDWQDEQAQKERDAAVQRFQQHIAQNAPDFGEVQAEPNPNATPDMGMGQMQPVPTMGPNDAVTGQTMPFPTPSTASDTENRGGQPPVPTMPPGEPPPPTFTPGEQTPPQDAPQPLPGALAAATPDMASQPPAAPQSTSDAQVARFLQYTDGLKARAGIADVAPFTPPTNPASLLGAPGQTGATPASTVAVPGQRPPGDLVPNQFGDASLSTEESYAACGPAAAVAFARSQGRNPTLREATDLAKQYGWTAQQGMAGAGSQQKLLSAMGVASRLEQGVDWAKVQADVQGGNPVIIDTPMHYFVATGYDPQSGKFNFEASGTALKAGSQWMTPAEVAKISQPRSALYLDNPATPTPSVVAGSSDDLHAYARQAASKAGIDPDLFERQIQTENGFRTKGGSSAGAQGIAQIVPSQHPGVDVNDPYASLDYAAKLMASHLKQYGGDYSLALAAYNAGPGNVQKYGGVPPFEETQRYVKTILNGQTPSAGSPTPTSGGGVSQPPAASLPQSTLNQGAVDRFNAWLGAGGPGQAVGGSMRPPAFTPPVNPVDYLQQSPVTPVASPFASAPSQPRFPDNSAMFAPPLTVPEPVQPTPAPDWNAQIQQDVQAGRDPLGASSYDQPTSVAPPPPGASGPQTFPQAQSPDGMYSDAIPPASARPDNRPMQDRIGQGVGDFFGTLGRAGFGVQPDQTPEQHAAEQAALAAQWNRPPTNPLDVVQQAPNVLAAGAPGQTQQNVYGEMVRDWRRGVETAPGAREWDVAHRGPLGLTPLDVAEGVVNLLLPGPEGLAAAAPAVGARLDARIAAQRGTMRQAAQQAYETSVRQGDDIQRATDAAVDAAKAAYRADVERANAGWAQDLGAQGRQPIELISPQEGTWAPPRPPGRNEPVQALHSGPPPANSYLDQLPGDVAGSQRSISAPQTQPALPGARPAPLDQPIPLRGAPAGWTPDVIEQGGRPTFPELPPGNAETRMRVRLEDAARSLEREAEHAMELGDTNKEIALRREAATARQAAAHPSAPPTPDTGVGVPRDPVGSPYDLSPYNDQLQHLAGLAPTDGVPGQFAQRRGATSFHLDPNYREDIPAAQMQWDRLNDADRAAMPYLDPNGPQGGYKYPPITDRGLPPGTSNLASGFAGAGFSQEGTDENTPPEERLKRAALGLGAGLLGAKVAGKVGPEIAAKAGREGFAANIRLAKYPEEVQNLIRAAADANPQMMESARRGVLSDQVVQDLSKYSGIDTEKIVKQWQPGQAKNAETLLAMRDALAGKARQLTEAQQAYRAEGGDSTQNLTRLNELVMEHAALQEAVSGTTAEAGRALRQFRQSVQGLKTPEDRLDALLKLAHKNGKKDQIETFLKNVDMSDPTAVANAARSLYNPKLPDLASWLWYNSLLSNPAGRMKDIISSGIATASYPLEKAAAVPFDIAQSKLLGTQRTVYAREVPIEYQAMAGSLRKGWANAMSVLAHGFTADQASHDLSAVAREPGSVDIAGKVIPIPDKVRGAISMPSRITAANDAFWRTWNYDASSAAIAFRRAKNEGLSGNKLTERAAQLVTDPATISEAMTTSKYRVWQEGGKLSNAITNLQNVPGMRVILPFAQTPLNLTRYVMERSPLGVGMLIGEHAGAATGFTTKPTTQHTAEALGRAAMGSAIMTGLYSLAQQGGVTGPMPEDQTARDSWQRQGKQPYSVLVGDKWHDYRMWAMAPLLGSVAAVDDAVRNGHTDNALAMMTSGSLGVSKAMLDQSFMQGLSTFAEAINDPGRRGMAWLESMAKSTVPGALQAVTRATDPIVRDPNGPWEAWLSAIPGLSTSIDPKRNNFGQRVERPASQQGAGVLLPNRPSDVKPSTLESEMARLQHGEYKVEPGAASQTVTVGKQPVKLDNAMYEQYRQVGGKLAYAILSQAADDPRWERTSDADKAKYIDDVIRKSREYAKEQLGQPLLNQAYRQYDEQQKRRVAGE